MERHLSVGVSTLVGLMAASREREEPDRAWPDRVGIWAAADREEEDSVPPRER